MTTLELQSEQVRARAAEAAATAAAAAAVPATRSFLAPEGQYYATSAAAWYSANAATFLRAHNPVAQKYRYLNLRIGASSGNIQAGVATLARAGSTVTATLVGSTGVIACPTAGDVRLDLGTALTVPAGDIALFLWCDNVTATFLHGAIAGFTASRLLFNVTVAGGIPAGSTTLATTTRFVTGLVLETDA